MKSDNVKRGLDIVPVATVDEVPQARPGSAKDSLLVGTNAEAANTAVAGKGGDEDDVGGVTPIEGVDDRVSWR